MVLKLKSNRYYVFENNLICFTNITTLYSLDNWWRNNERTLYKIIQDGKLTYYCFLYNGKFVLLSISKTILFVYDNENLNIYNRDIFNELLDILKHFKIKSVEYGISSQSQLRIVPSIAITEELINFLNINI